MISFHIYAGVRNKANQSLKEGCSKSLQEINKGQIFLLLEVNEFVLPSPILLNG